MMIRFLQFILLFPIVLLYGQAEKSYSYYIDIANKLKSSDWKKAELNIKKAQNIVLEKDLGDFYLKSANIYNDVDRFDAALEFCVEAQKIFTKDKNDEKIAKTNGLFAFIYTQMNDTELAISYYKKTLKFYKKKKDNESVLKALNNLGNAYRFLGKLDSSQYYFEQSLPILDQYNNPVLEATVLSNIGKLSFFKGKVSVAEKYFLDAINILDKDNIQDKESRYLVNYNLGNFYAAKNDPQKALTYIENTQKYVDTKTPNFQNVVSLKSLYEVYLLNNDYKNSAKVFKRYDSIRELLNIEQKAVNIEKMKVQYEYELQKKVKDLEESKKNVLFIVVVAILILLAIICLLLLINYRNKAEQLRLENKLIEEREKQLDIDNQLKEKMLVHKSMEQSRIEEIFKSILNWSC